MSDSLLHSDSQYSLSVIYVESVTNVRVSVVIRCINDGGLMVKPMSSSGDGTPLQWFNI